MAGKTLYDKIWDAHLVAEQDGEAILYIDLHLIHEVTTPQAFAGLRANRRKVRRPDRTLAVADHNIPTEGQGLGVAAVADEEARLKAGLRRQFPQHLAEAFTQTRYGSTFTWLGLLPFAIPVWLNLLWLLALPPGAATAGCLAANLVFSTPYLVFSKWVHPYMHMRFEDAMQETSGLLRRILGSPYGVAIRISHYVHHQDPKVNYNLQYLADRLRGRWRAPTPEEWDDMISLSLVEPHHRTQLEGRTFLGHPF